MTDTAEAPKRGFFLALLSDEKGVPDESCVAFLVAGAALTAGAFINTFSAHQFPLASFACAVCALIPLYRAARGDWRKP